VRVHIASDHAGFDLKGLVAQHLRDRGIEVIDHGADTYDALDDYPPYCLDCGEAVVADPGSLGVVIGGSGNGEQIAANKVRGVRAALAWSDDTARLARQHNDANIVAIGARMHEPGQAVRLIDLFVDTPFSGDRRHRQRIGLLDDYEATAGPCP